ncbi:MAG: amidohydrolase [Prolixibacteraceae bacterium]|nr:amidohydrolase [Prolixibacteraceae bacterium]MBN2773157.1 amidohydrolase [Prolixibacteraceae bacterium]
MKENLKITIVQFDILWEDPLGNLQKLDSLLKGLGETDLIILPEMFTSGFSMNPSALFEFMDGNSVQWMKNKSRDLNTAITGSLIIKDQGKMYNRALFITPDGKTEYYDKRHLYTMGDEHNHYIAGKNKLIVEYKGWKVCPLICYDLRFPVWSRNQEDYDILIYMANWPSPRHHVWKNLLAARAIENQSYCFGVNRIGSDGTGLNYLGDSAMIDAKGFGHFLGSEEKIHSFKISFSGLHNFRKKFPLLQDKDSFEII